MKEETNKDSIVFIVNQGFHDYSPAEDYGKLVFMSTDPNGISQYNTSAMARLFHSYIEQSSPSDYILVTSFSVMVTVAASMFAHKHGRLNLLIYRPGEHRYVARNLIMKEGEINEPTE